MRESSVMANLCPMFPEGPAKMAIQHAENGSLLVHALRKRNGVARREVVGCESGDNRGWGSKRRGG